MTELRTERDIVNAIVEELENDQRFLEQLMVQHPIVGNAIIKLRMEKAELQIRVNQLEQEVLRLQHGRVPFHDLGQ